MTFFSLEELNKAVAECARKYNQKRLTGCDYSRIECFLASEKPELSPLPETPFEMKRRTTLKVAPNSFVTFGNDRISYSVPYRLIGQQVDVTFTATQVCIYHGGERVAVHVRSYKKNGYIYVIDHLPPQSQAYRAYSADYFIEKAGRISPEFKKVVEAIFAGPSPEQVYFKTVQGFFKLQRESDPQLFRRACSIAIAQDNLRYKFVKALVGSRCSGFNEDPNVMAPPVSHTNVRGKTAFS